MGKMLALSLLVPVVSLFFCWLVYLMAIAGYEGRRNRRLEEEARLRVLAAEAELAAVLRARRWR